MNKNFKVYIHVSPSWKYYVGITSLDNVCSRWGKDGNGYKTQYFSRAINKYKWDNFAHIIVRDNLSKHEACELEKDLILTLKSNNPQYGYNISDGGDCSMLGKHHTKEAKEKIAERFSEPVNQYNINGQLIKQWNSMSTAGRELNIDSSSISKCCKGIYKTSKGYVWRYIGDDLNKYSSKKHYIRKMKKIKQYTIEGDLIKIWKGISCAAKQLNLKVSSISACCKGRKGRKTYAGYVWRYINDNFDKYNIENEKKSKIIQYDINGNAIQNFNSICDAHRETNISKSNISMCCSGKIKTAGGFNWEYRNPNSIVGNRAIKQLENNII